MPPQTPQTNQNYDPDSPLGGPLELPEDQTQSPSSYTPPPPSPHDPKPKSKKVLVIVVVIVVLMAAGIGAWLVLGKDSGSNSNQSTQATEPAPTSKTEMPSTTNTKTYTNDRMRLSINYPDNWTVTEEDNAARIESPDFTYNTTDKGEVTGNFRIYIRQGAQAADSTYIGKGVAILPSEKFVYSQPTTNQRKDTFLSSFGLTTENNFAFFLIAGNFELKKGETLGPNYGKEPDTYIIGGGYSSKDMKDGLETNLVPVDEYQESTAYKQAVEALKTIQIK